MGEVHRRGSIQQEAFSNDGTLLEARVPESLAARLRPLQLNDEEFEQRRLALQLVTAL